MHDVDHPALAEESWTRGDIESAVRHALAAADAASDPDAMLRTACAYALRRHRTDLLVPHVAAVERMAVGVERDGVLASIRLGRGDLAGALALALAPLPARDSTAGHSAAGDLRAATIVHVGLGALAAGAWRDAGRCVEAAATALATYADGTGEETARFELLGMRAVVEAHTAGGDDAFHELEAALAPLRARNLLSSHHALALLCLADVLHLRGALGEAAINYARGVRLADPDRPGFVAHATVSLAFIRIRQGRWEDAASAVESLGTSDATIEHDWIRTQVLAVRGLVAAVKGDFERADPLLSESAALSTRTSSYLASTVLLHARIAGAIGSGRWEALARCLDDAEEPGYRHPYRAGEWSALTLLAAWHLGDHRELSARLEVWAENPDAASDPYYWAFAAILSEHQHRHTDGLAAIERALDSLGRDQDPLGRAWVRMVAGTYLSRYGRAGEPDPARALAVYDAAIAELREMGAAAFVERCEAIAGTVRAGLERTRREHPVTVLSEQQRRIAVAVARGYTSEEIAAIEYVSKRTIDYHVRNIVRRLGITSRREIARVLADAAA